MGISTQKWFGSVKQQYYNIKLVDMAVELFYTVNKSKEWIEIMVEQDLLRFLPTYFLDENYVHDFEEYRAELPQMIEEWLHERKSDNAMAEEEGILNFENGYHFMKLVDCAIKKFNDYHDVEERMWKLMEEDLLRFLPLYCIRSEDENECDDYEGTLPVHIQEWLDQRQVVRN